MVVKVSAVYLRNCMADWELCLTAAAQHQKRILYCILLAQEKNQNLKFEVWLLLNEYQFRNTVKLKNHKSNHKSGNICISFPTRRAQRAAQHFLYHFLPFFTLLHPQPYGVICR